MYNCLDSDRTVCRGLFIQHTESGMLMNNREKIVMKAFDLFMTNNGIGLSLNDILKELNMTKGGFYYYFKSRDELIEEVIQKYMLDILWKPLNYIRNNTDESMDTYERLKRCYCILPNPEVLDCEGKVIKKYSIKSYFLILYSLLEKHPILSISYKSFYEENIGMIVDAIKTGIEKEEIKSCISPECYAEMLIAIRDGIVALSLIDDEINIENRLEKSFQTAWKEMCSGVL